MLHVQCCLAIARTQIDWKRLHSVIRFIHQGCHIPSLVEFGLLTLENKSNFLQKKEGENKQVYEQTTEKYMTTEDHTGMPNENPEVLEISANRC